MIKLQVCCLISSGFAIYFFSAMYNLLPEVIHINDLIVCSAVGYNVVYISP